MKKLLRFFVILLMLSGTAGLVAAQNLRITGQVTDKSTGEVLPTANVYIVELNRGATTNMEGRYDIPISTGTYTLQVSFIGYRRFSTSVTVGNQDVTLNVALEASTLNLDELVVVGFGTQSRASITGSISQVSGETIEKMPVNTVENAMQGRVAGVFVQQNNGKLGQGIQIRVRGSSSVTASNQPLYVVDGIPVVMDDFSLSSAATNPMAQFNFNDVESIQILKDASAAAIFGSRAANGVVLITTKQGRPGRTNFNYTFQMGTSEPTNKIDMMNAKEYINYMYQAAKNTDRIRASQGLSQNRVFILEDTFDYYSLGTDWRRCLASEHGGQGGECVVDTPWQDLAFQDAGMYTHDLSASGGNDATRFFISGHYSDQDGILIKDRFQRVTGRLNLDHRATSKINVGMNLNIGRSFHQRLSNDNAFSTPLQSIAQMPISPLFYPVETSLPNYVPSSELNNDTYYYNGIIHKDFSKYNVTSMRSTGSAYFVYKVIPELEFKSEVSADIVTGSDDQWYSPKTAVGFASAANGGYASIAWQQTQSYATSNYLNYSGNFGQDHSLSGTAGMNYQYNDYNYALAAASGFPNDSFQRLTSAANVLSGTSTGSEYSFLSYFLRGNYGYKDKYLLSLSGRVDGSSRFGKDNRYGFFPAASVGWVLTEENFALGWNDMLTYLKLRASYGITGNAAIGNFGSLGLWGGTSYGGQSGIAPSQIPNPNLTWETTRQFNAGFDFGFLNNRITGEFDYYIKNTEDLLLSVQIPATSGFNTSLRNVGEMQNKGFELVLNSFNLTGDFVWNTNFNIAYNQNKVTNLDGQVITSGLSSINRAMEGQPIGVFFMPIYAGVNPDNGDALWYTYSDDDCKVQTGTTSVFNDANMCVAGNPNPRFTGGFNNSFAYKGFDLSVLFQFVEGNDTYIGGHGRWSRGNGVFEDNSVSDQLRSWTTNNRNTNIPEARYLITNGNQHSSRYISDGSYIRLKNVTLSYNVPRRLIGDYGFTKARLFATGVNLMTWTNYLGWDPEMNTDWLAGNISLGTDFYTAPQAKTFTVGIDIGF